MDSVPDTRSSRLGRHDRGRGGKRKYCQHFPEREKWLRERLSNLSSITVKVYRSVRNCAENFQDPICILQEHPSTQRKIISSHTTLPLGITLGVHYTILNMSHALCLHLGYKLVKNFEHFHHTFDYIDFFHLSRVRNLLIVQNGTH